MTDPSNLEPNSATRNMTNPNYHKHSLVEPGATVGERTRVWAFAHVCDGAVIGEDCNLCDHTYFEKGVLVGARVTIKMGVYLCDGNVLEDDVFVGPTVSFTNDLRPRSRNTSFALLKTTLCRGCTVGANSTILPVTIGAWAMVAAGAVVTRDVPAHALVRGSPAKIAGWVCRCAETLKFGGSNKAICACGRAYQKTSESSIEESMP